METRAAQSYKHTCKHTATHTLLLLDQQVYKLTPAGVTLTGVLFNAPVVDKTW